MPLFASAGKPGCFFFLGGYEEGLGGLSELPPLGLGAGTGAATAREAAASPGAFATPAANAARAVAERKQRSNCICHGTAFDFNDNVVPGAAALWVRLVEQRLGCQLYSDDELGPEAVTAAAAAAAAALLASS